MEEEEAHWDEERFLEMTMCNVPSPITTILSEPGKGNMEDLAQAQAHMWIGTEKRVHEIYGTIIFLRITSTNVDRERENSA